MIFQSFLRFLLRQVPCFFVTYLLSSLKQPQKETQSCPRAKFKRAFIVNLCFDKYQRTLNNV